MRFAVKFDTIVVEAPSMGLAISAAAEIVAKDPSEHVDSVWKSEHALATEVKSEG